MNKKEKQSNSKYADLRASTLNRERFGCQIYQYESPYLNFLFNHQHPFLSILNATERTNASAIETAFIFTFLHQLNNQPLIDIVFENTNLGKATLIFSIHFHANIRYNYLSILHYIRNYFSSSVFNKRQKLIKAAGISSNKPQFTLSLSRVVHDDFYHWSKLLENKAHMYLPNAYGCLKDHLADGQKMAQEFLMQ